MQVWRTSQRWTGGIKRTVHQREQHCTGLQLPVSDPDHDPHPAILALSCLQAAASRWSSSSSRGGDGRGGGLETKGAGLHDHDCVPVARSALAPSMPDKQTGRQAVRRYLHGMPSSKQCGEKGGGPGGEGGGAATGHSLPPLFPFLLLLLLLLFSLPYSQTPPRPHPRSAFAAILNPRPPSTHTHTRTQCFKARLQSFRNVQVAV